MKSLSELLGGARKAGADANKYVDPIPGRIRSRSNSLTKQLGGNPNISKAAIGKALKKMTPSARKMFLFTAVGLAAGSIPKDPEDNVATRFLDVQATGYKWGTEDARSIPLPSKIYYVLTGDDSDLPPDIEELDRIHLAKLRAERDKQTTPRQKSMNAEELRVWRANLKQKRQLQKDQQQNDPISQIRDAVKATRLNQTQVQRAQQRMRSQAKADTSAAPVDMNVSNAVMPSAQPSQADTVLDSVRMAVKAKATGQSLSVMQQQAQELRNMQARSRERQAADLLKYTNDNTI